MCQTKKDLVISGPQLATWSFTRAAFAKKGDGFSPFVGRSFHSPGFPRVVRQALVWRCSWNAYGTKTGLRKFVVPFPLESRWCLIPKKPEMLGSFSRRIFQMFFQIANCLKKTPRTGSTLAACPENSEVCLWTSVPLAKKFFVRIPDAQWD